MMTITMVTAMMNPFPLPFCVSPGLWTLDVLAKWRDQQSQVEQFNALEATVEMMESSNILNSGTFGCRTAASFPAISMDIASVYMAADTYVNTDSRFKLFE